jgi:hypothetical protein
MKDEEYRAGEERRIVFFRIDDTTELSAGVCRCSMVRRYIIPMCQKRKIEE